MADTGLLKLNGAPPPQDKWTTIAFVKNIGGIQTQRNPLASCDNRYNSAFLGSKPDSLIAGQNVEISNRLTLQRRPGLIPYGTANIPSPTAFFDWQLATTGDIILVTDTKTGGGDNSVGANGGVLRYSPTSSGIYINKAANSKQTNFETVVNTMYMGDGVDLFKVIGPNLLQQSNTFGTGAGTNFSIQSPWTQVDVFSLTEGQTDPLGGTNATQLIWSTASSSAQLEQNVTPNYTPIASNTFTFSFWMKHSGTAISVDLEIADQNGSVVDTTFALTTSWVKYSVTATMNSNSNVIKVLLRNPTTTQTMFIYGGQLEVGGPATTTQITTTHPQGVYLWGIQAPAVAPLPTPSAAVVGAAWAPNKAYVTAQYALTSVANASAGSTVYTGVFPNGHSNGLSGQSFTIADFLNAANNGYFSCTASTATTITLNNAVGVVETDPAVAIPTVTLTSVALNGVYFGTIAGGGSNDLAGYGITFSGFVNPSNNGTFYCISSTGSTLIMANPNTIAETASAKAQIIGQSVTDSNGNLEVATVSGTSGSAVPTWNISEGQTTLDGVENVFIIQSAQGNSRSGTSTVTAAFPANVKASDSLFVFVALNASSSKTCTITDTQNNPWTQVATAASGPFNVFMFWTKSAAAGATTVTATVSGAQGVWLGIIEASSSSAIDANNTNSVASVPNGNAEFQTGVVTTTTTHDFVVSFAAIIAGNHAASTLGLPSAFSSMVSGSGITVSEGQFTTNAAFLFSTIATVINPQWAVTFSAGGSREMGITAAFQANNTATLLWTNYGPVGLTASIGFTYYYAFMNSQTGHVSNLSPVSTSTGVLAGQSVIVTGQGMQNAPSGTYAQDPQVDTIALFRNDDGGGFWFQLATFANPGTATVPGSWSYTDTTPSTSLNTAIFAPVSDLNSLPPAGLVDMDYFAGRMWGSVANFLYYNTAADNAQLVNVTQNGVPSESWDPENVIPFNAPITRIVACGGGLIVFTTTDTWMVVGQNLLTGAFNPIKVLANHGLRSYNAVGVDGSSLYLYTSDRQCLLINPNSGSNEVGYIIGDFLEENFSPVNAYVVRHVSGSQDNAVYLSDGVSQWMRLNPNQQGASTSGEQTPVWSPAANFTASIGGIGAIASIETSAGVIQLLVGQPSVGPVLARSLTTFSDNGTPYQWSATIGSVLLTTPGTLAETESVTVEMNNVGGSYTASQCSVAVLLDEIGGTFESLPMGVNDPPQLITSSTILANRYYLSQGNRTPICRHMQIQLSGAVTSGLFASTRDEILSTSIRGAHVPEMQ